MWMLLSCEAHWVKLDNEPGTSSTDKRLIWFSHRCIRREVKARSRKTENGRTNRNHYQPRILCPSNDIEAGLAQFGVGHAKRQTGELHWERENERKQQGRKEWRDKAEVLENETLRKVQSEFLQVEYRQKWAKSSKGRTEKKMFVSWKTEEWWLWGSSRASYSSLIQMSHRSRARSRFLSWAPGGCGGPPCGSAPPPGCESSRLYCPRWSPPVGRWPAATGHSEKILCS